MAPAFASLRNASSHVRFGAASLSDSSCVETVTFLPFAAVARTTRTAFADRSIGYESAHSKILLSLEYNLYPLGHLWNLLFEFGA